jgi:ribonucleotide monophosphatase NagD (HAD superfamily)
MQNLRFMVVDADDFEAMRTGAALSALGHRVDKFTSAEIASEALADMPGLYDAVVASELDNMTRADFEREAQSTHSRLRVIFTNPDRSLAGISASANEARWAEPLRAS